MPSHLNFAQQLRNFLLVVVVVTLAQLICAYALPYEISTKAGNVVSLLGGLAIIFQLTIACLAYRKEKNKRL